jgi:hypothetical protein
MPGMTTRTDFTEQEWETMQKAATGAGLLVSLADRGFFDSFKEASAIAKHLKETHEQSDSRLVQELAAVRGTGFGLTTSDDEVESETLAALRSAVSTLERKAPDELPAFRAFVLDVARSVGEAAGGGVDEAESGALAKIGEALGPG